MRYLMPILMLLAGCNVAVNPGPSPSPSPSPMPSASPTPTPTPTPTPSATPTPGPSFPLEQAFSIKVGETRSNGELRLSFTAVTEDSRCPSDVVCVWAGQAKASLRFSQGSQSEDIVLTLPQTTPVLSANGRYRFVPESLSPYPKASDPIKPGDYVLRLRVEAVR